MGQSVRFTGSGTCDDEEGSLAKMDGLFLPIVQGGQRAVIHERNYSETVS